MWRKMYEVDRSAVFLGGETFLVQKGEAITTSCFVNFLQSLPFKNSFNSHMLEEQLMTALRIGLVNPFTACKNTDHLLSRH